MAKSNTESHASALDAFEIINQSILGDESESMTRATRTMDGLHRKVLLICSMLVQADACLKKLKGRLATVETIEKPGGAQSERQGKGLLDPKVMTVTALNGTKAGEFVGWRNLMEKALNEYNPGLRQVLKATRLKKNKITEAEFDEIPGENTISLRWSYERMNYEHGAYLLTNLSLTPSRKRNRWP